MSRPQLTIILSLISLSTSILAMPPLSLTIEHLKEKFSTEPESIRLFRAKGMLNNYYKMRKSNPTKATAYLATIIHLFPEVPRARLEWVFELERKGDLAGAYHYLLPLKNEFQDNKKIQSTLTDLAARLRDLQPAPVAITPKKPVAPIVIPKKIKAIPTDNDMMNAYYALKKENDPNSGALLQKISTQFQSNFDAETEMGYALLAQNKDKEALPYFLRAQEIRPGDFELANQIGFIECNLGQQKQAYQQFYNATKSNNTATASQAQVALINLSDWKFKYLPNPWFFEFYTEPYYTSRFNDFIDPLEARLGAALGRYKQFWVYLSYRRSSDTASVNSGVAPQIYNDNAGVIAGGTRIFPVATVPWFFYAEYGAAYNIKEQLNEPTWRQDFRGGSSYGQLWGAKAAYDSSLVTEFKPWTEVYVNVGYYSRYSNWIGQGRQRIGARVLRWRHTTLSPYIMGQIFFDSQRLYYNNVVEYGPGIALQPYNLVNFSISYEHLFGNYIPTADASNNPYGTHYETNIVRAQFFIRI